MTLATLTVGLLAMSDPLGLLSVVGQAGAGNVQRLLVGPGTARSVRDQPAGLSHCRRPDPAAARPAAAGGAFSPAGWRPQ